MKFEYFWVEESWLNLEPVKQMHTGNVCVDLQGHRWVEVFLPTVQRRNKDGTYQEFLCYPHGWQESIFLSDIGKYL
jgi:hypothetical protein